MTQRSLNLNHCRSMPVTGSWNGTSHYVAQRILTSSDLADVRLPALEQLAHETDEWSARLDDIEKASAWPDIDCLDNLPTVAEWTSVQTATNMLAPMQKQFGLWLIRETPKALAADQGALVTALRPKVTRAVKKITALRDALEFEPPHIGKLENVGSRDRRIALRDALDAADLITESVNFIASTSATRCRVTGVGGILHVAGTDELHEDVVEAEERDQEWALPLAVARAAKHGTVTLRTPAEAIAADERRTAAREAAEAAQQSRYRVGRNYPVPA